MLQGDADAVFELAHLHARVVAQHRRLARAARTQPFQDLHRSRLARSIGPQQAEHLAARYFEIDAPDRLEVPVAFPETAHRDHAIVRGTQAAITGASAITFIAARQKAGRSSGLRDVTKLWSTTTSLSS